MSASDHFSRPPHCSESEQAVLGCLLSSPSAIDRVADVLMVDDFYVGDHRLIFATVAQVIERGQVADALAVWEALGKPALGQSGDIAYLTLLANSACSLSTVRQHAAAIADSSVLRKLAAVGADLQMAAMQPGAEATEIVGETEAQLTTALDRHAGEALALDEAMGEALAYVDARQQSGGRIAGLRTGLPRLDALLGGLDPGQLVILAARPSVGKTAIGVQIASAVAADGKTVILHSLEMTRREIGARVLALRSGIGMHCMRSGIVNDAGWQQLVDEREAARSEKLFVDDMSGISVAYARAKARRIKRQHGLDLLTIDYLGLMRGQGENRTQEIGSISRGLKALAKELEVPILCLAQLNRGVEDRHDKRPMLRDLRDSGEIEQDADIVIMLHRESLYSPTAEWQGQAELLVRKNRNGPTGDLLLRFDEKTGRFSESNEQSPRSQKAPPEKQGFK